MGYASHPCQRLNTDSPGVVCWFCPVCHTLTLWESAERGECAQTPQREDCYLLLLRDSGKADEI
jgi:hypothetical protein